MGATDTIANWIVNTTYEAIPPEAIRVANESCFEMIGVILSGSAQPAGEIIKKYVADQGAAPPSYRAVHRRTKLGCQCRFCQRHHGTCPGLRRLRRPVIPPSLSSPPCWPSANTPEPRAGTFWKLTWSDVRSDWRCNTPPSTSRWTRAFAALRSSAGWLALPLAPS